MFMLFKIWNSLEKSAFVTVGHFVDVHNMHCNDISFSIVTYPSEVHSNTLKKLLFPPINGQHGPRKLLCCCAKIIISEHCSVF